MLSSLVGSPRFPVRSVYIAFSSLVLFVLPPRFLTLLLGRCHTLPAIHIDVICRLPRRPFPSTYSLTYLFIDISLASHLLTLPILLFRRLL